MKICFAVRILSGALLAFYMINVWSVYHFSQTTQTRPADCVIILGAGITGSHPSPVFRERLEHAITLYRQGYVKKAIVTGGFSPGNFISDAATGQRYLIAHGVRASDIFIEQQSRVTRKNLRYAHEIMRENHFGTALIVSDPLHMKRAMLIARDAGIAAFSSPTPSSRFHTLNAQLPFLLREAFYYSGYQPVRYFVALRNTVQNPSTLP